MTSFRRKHGPEKVGRVNSSKTLLLVSAEATINRGFWHELFVAIEI
jgi:hypothetical protein